MSASPAESPIPDNLDEDLPYGNDEEFSEGEEDGEDVQEEEEEDLSEEYEEDSDQSPSSSGEENEEFMMVDLADLRRDVQCPICLGIIRKTKTVMECLHRFCKECIDKSMRLGNRECPACRTHCPSRRSLREDPNFDKIIALLFPDIDRYEDEELAIHQEEDARNKQIQASIAETFARQAEALTKKRKRSQSTTRKKANYCSNEDDGANGNGSSADEHQEARRKQSRRLKSQRSPAAAMADGGFEENDIEADRDTAVAPGALAGSSEMLVWGRGGTRSQSRHGNAGGSISKLARSNRLARLAEHLQIMEANNEVDIHIILVSLDAANAPRLQQPYLCCNPTLSIRQISEFIAHQTTLQANEVEILAVKELHSNFSSLMSLDVQPANSSPLDAAKDELLPLDFELSLEAVKSRFIHKQGRLILAYRQKSPDQEARNKAVVAVH